MWSYPIIPLHQSTFLEAPRFLNILSLTISIHYWLTVFKKTNMNMIGKYLLRCFLNSLLKGFFSQDHVSLMSFHLHKSFLLRVFVRTQGFDCTWSSHVTSSSPHPIFHLYSLALKVFYFFFTHSKSFKMIVIHCFVLNKSRVSKFTKSVRELCLIIFSDFF